MHCLVRWRGELAALALAVVVAACGGGGGGPAAANPGGTGGTGGTSTNVAINSSLSFSPSSTTVPAGSSVTWTWDSCSGDGYGGSICVDHNVTWDDAAAGASATQHTGTYTRTFAAPGTYSYHCSIHGTATSGMRGTVTVQ